MASNGTSRLVDGQISFEGGIDSGRVPTKNSPGFDTGLKPNQLSWLTNGTCRGGGVNQRTGWKPLVRNATWPGIFQAAYMYEPPFADPYIVAMIGGRIYRIRVDTDNSVEDLSAAFGNLTMPPNEPIGFMAQGEEFLVIQSGDLITLPLFWDGVTMRRSVGFLGIGAGPNTLADTFQITIQNVNDTRVGTVIPAGSLFTNDAGNFTLKAPFTIPAVAGSAVAEITEAYPGTPPVTVKVFVDHPILPKTFTWTITAKATIEGATTGIASELPAAGPMDYYMGRFWYAFGRQYCAGDIVGSQASGTIQYRYRDSILKTTENPVSLAGDAFIVPTNAGNIRALKHSANLDSALGEGSLYVFTRKNIYCTTVPATRALWSQLREPLQRVAQRDFGSVGDRCVVPVNGDLFYQAMDGIRSLTVAIRYFQQWGNIPISKPEQRVLRFNDRALMRFASGINFDNRLWQTVVPFQTAKGVAHQGVIPLDFDLLGSMADRLPPAWEGMYEGLHFLQLLEADFGGLQRGFSFVVSQVTGNIDIWEMTTQDRFDSQVNGDGSRVSWYLETPAYTWNDPFLLKKLDGLELWFDKMLGTVQFMVEYKVDQSPCWLPWHAWKQCVAKDCREDPEAVTCPSYPVQPYCEGFKATVSLPAPPNQCEPNNARPTTEGYQFQVRLSIKGWCRLRGLRIYAQPKAKTPYQNMLCSASDFFETEPTPNPPPPEPPIPPEPPVPPEPPDPPDPPDENFISWNPDTASAGWEDGAANFFTGDLATFLATADLNDMPYFELLSQGITTITGLHLMVTCAYIDLGGNALTSIASFSASMTTIALGANQLTNIGTLPVGLTTLGIGGNLFSAAKVNSICGELVTNGLNNGTLDLTGLDASIALGNIAILQGRGWTVLT